VRLDDGQDAGPTFRLVDWRTSVAGGIDVHRHWKSERYGAFHDWPTWRALVTAAGFDELDRFYRPPGLPIGRQPWLASVWRKR
jgi:hypothetical protein